MHNQIIIHKYNSFPFRQVVGPGHAGTAGLGLERPLPTGGALPDDRKHFEHGGHEDAKGAAQAFGRNGFRRADLVVDPLIHHRPREHGPEIVRGGPALFLEKGAKVRVLIPEASIVRMVCEGMLRETHPLKGLAVEPIDIRVCVPRVPRPSIHLPLVNRPEIGHHIQIVLRDSPFCVLVDEARAEQRLHCGSARDPVA
jgi:hypothetical protein